MYRKINIYYFNTDYEKQIENFISEINNYLYNHNKLTTNEIQENFKIIIDNFKTLMEYFGIDENWNIKDIYVSYQLNLSLIYDTKKYIASSLELGIKNKEYTNIIFEFHRYAPFHQEIVQIYKLIINSMLYTTKEHGIYKQPVLSLYLTNAIIYNNFDAIKILTEEYNVSPITIWSRLPRQYKNLELKIMPLVQTMDHITEKKFIKFFYTNKQHQEQNFIFMLSKINFNEQHTHPWQAQEIFKYAFKNHFVLAINYLLEQQGFCEKLRFAKEELIMLAFSKLFVNQYNQLINIILTHPNISNNPNINIKDIEQQLAHYINILNNMLIIDKNCQNLDHVVLKIVLEFTETYLANNYTTNQELLIDSQQKVELLLLQNDSLVQNNALLQQQLLLSLDCLQRSNDAIRTLQSKSSPINSSSIDKVRTELQKTKVQYKNLLHAYNLLLTNNENRKTFRDKQYNYPLKRSNSFYL